MELVSEHNEFAKYNVNIQKSITFLFTSNEQVKFEIESKIPFTLASPKMEYSGINLTKYAQDLYEENYNTLTKDTKEKLNKWRDIACSLIGRLNIVKMSVLHNLTYTFNAIPFKIQVSYFMDIDKLILKCICRRERPRITNSLLSENKAGGLILFNFKACYKATIIKTVCYW